MDPTIDLRLAHYPTRTPILIELKMQRDATVHQLRAEISEAMQADEHCLMRVFGRLFVEIQVKEVKRLCAIEPSDEGESLLRLGVEDGDVVYLEGPLCRDFDSAEDVGMAIALLNGKVERHSAYLAAQRAEHTLRMQRLEEESRKVMQQLSEKIDSLRCDVTQQDTETQTLRNVIAMDKTRILLRWTPN